MQNSQSFRTQYCKTIFVDHPKDLSVLHFDSKQAILQNVTVFYSIAPPTQDILGTRPTTFQLQMLETFQSDSFGIKWVAQSSGRKSQDPSSRVSFRDNSSLRVFISFFRSLLFSLLFASFKTFLEGESISSYFRANLNQKMFLFFPRNISQKTKRTNDRQNFSSIPLPDQRPSEQFIFHA